MDLFKFLYLMFSRYCVPIVSWGNDSFVWKRVETSKKAIPWSPSVGKTQKKCKIVQFYLAVYTLISVNKKDGWWQNYFNLWYTYLYLFKDFVFYSSSRLITSGAVLQTAFVKLWGTHVGSRPFQMQLKKRPTNSTNYSWSSAT